MRFKQLPDTCLSPPQYPPPMHRTMAMHRNALRRSISGKL